MNDSTPISAARQYLWNNWDEGVKCPCCTQHVQRYRRLLNAGMARALIIMYQIQKNREKGAWIRVADELTKRKINAANTEYSMRS